MKLRKKFHFPIKLMLFTWGAVIASRLNIFLAFDSLAYKTILYLSSFLLLTIAGFYISLPNKKAVIKNVTTPTVNEKFVSRKKINFLFWIIVALSFVSIVGEYIKQIEIGGSDFSFSLETFAKNRMEASFKGKEKGSSVIGIISTTLSGFPVLAIVVSRYYKDILKKWQDKVLLLIFLIGIIFTFTGGGRFGAFFSFLVFIFSKSISPKKFLKNLKKEKKSSKLPFILLGAILFIVFAQLFVHRQFRNAENLWFYYSLVDNLDHCEPTSFYKRSLYDVPEYFPVFSIIAYFQYYIGHSFTELEVLISHQEPSSYPYFGAYQLYPFALLFRKLGASIISIETILSEIANPGVYFTLIGAFYLDFGRYGMFFFFFLLGFGGGKIWYRYLKKRTIISYYISILFILILCMSPIISTIGTSIFPALITSVIILHFIDITIKLPKINPYA